jgi:hypothetical protein
MPDPPQDAEIEAELTFPGPSLQFFGATKQKKHCISCEYSDAWKLAVSGRLLPAFWQVTN